VSARPTAATPDEPLRSSVLAALAARAAAVRAELPPRPAGGTALYGWWRSLDAAQARRAMLLDRLDALHAHVEQHPTSPIPAAAMEEAQGHHPLARRTPLSPGAA
jgi:hypothetical protein